MTYTYTAPKPRKKPLRVALTPELLSATSDDRWHSDGFVFVKAPSPEGMNVVLGNRGGNVEKLQRRFVRRVNKEGYKPAKVLAKFAHPDEKNAIKQLLVLEAHHHTGPILVSHARFDYIMAFYPNAEVLTTRRSSSFVAFRQGKSIVGFLAEVVYAEPSEIATAMHLALA